MKRLSLLLFFLPFTAAAEDFAHQVDQTRAIQAMSADAQGVHRAVHNKAHGCLVGELQIDPERPAALRVGLFRDTANYPVWTRFSNGSPRQRPDSLLDARGLAIKVLGTRRLNPSIPTQDLVLINMEQAPGRTPEEFMDFMVASASGNLTLAWFLTTHPPIAAVFARAALHQVKSLVTETYWSVTPFALGPQASKFVVSPSYDAPCAPVSPSRPWFAGAGYLSDDLKAEATAHPICYDVSVQLQNDANPAATPIEDAMTIWRTPHVRLARLILPSQEFSSPAQTEYCERLNFTPWHNLPEHQPLGRLNAARAPVYKGSQDNRANANGPLPEPEEIVTVDP